MPLYTIYHHSSTFNPTGTATSTKHTIAKGITEVHVTVTGAPRQFVKVIFVELKDDEIFSGGEPDPTLIRVTGAIRSGRGIEDRTMILGGINQVIKALEPRAFVEIHLQEVPSENMMAEGHILPLPGSEEEAAWAKNEGRPPAN